MKMKNIFKKEKPIEELGTINLTFKMPLINFLNYFRSNNKWEVGFSDSELDKIEKSIKKAREGITQDLVFEDGLNEYLKKLGLLEEYKK